MVRISSALIALSVLLAEGTLAIWPNPTKLSTGSTYLKLSPSFSIEFTGKAPSDLQSAIARVKTQLNTDKFERLVVGRGGADALFLSKAKELKKLTLSIVSVAGSEADATSTNAIVIDDDSISTSAAASASPKSIFENIIVDAEARVESYNLKIPSDGSTATLTAPNALGLFRGLTTFAQLFYTSGSTVYAYNAPIAISDKPAFPHRGLLLDTARNFLPKSDILRTIDAMSWAKVCS